MPKEPIEISGARQCDRPISKVWPCALGEHQASPYLRLSDVKQQTESVRPASRLKKRRMLHADITQSALRCLTIAAMMGSCSHASASDDWVTAILGPETSSKPARLPVYVSEDTGSDRQRIPATSSTTTARWPFENQTPEAVDHSGYSSGFDTSLPIDRVDFGSILSEAEPTNFSRLEPNQSEAVAGSVTPSSVERRNEAAPPSTDAISRQETVIRGTAKREKYIPPLDPNYLRTTTAEASFHEASELLTQAHSEFKAQAWLSAEHSAWEAITLCARGIDLSRKTSGFDSAMYSLQVGKDAFTEARDFGGIWAPTDSDAIARLARSHRTDLLDNAESYRLTSTDAVGRYLDHARKHLANLASHSVECAQALDLIAAVHLGRNDADRLPSESSLCLRRAALQGQPGNADLASKLGHQLQAVGLTDEAHWALQHSLTIEFNPIVATSLAGILTQKGETSQANALLARVTNEFPESQNTADAKTPVFTELTPEQFASISGSVIPRTNSAGTNSAGTVLGSNGTPASLTSARVNGTTQVGGAPTNPITQPTRQTTYQPPQQNPAAKQGGSVRRWFDSIRNAW